jgi:hypothetical protein
MSRHDRKHSCEPLPSAEEAKIQLLHWGVHADEELHAKLKAMADSARSTVKAAAPWAAGAALLAGVLFGKRRKKSDEPRSPFSIFKMIGFAVKATPFVLQLLKARRER